MTQKPTVFVALLVEPKQFDLFSEVLTEAIDVLDEQTHPMSGSIASRDDLVLLDREELRLALSWSSGANGDILTLAAGTQPDRDGASQCARYAADMLQKLVDRATALFETRRVLWQVAFLPLTPTTLGEHARQIAHLRPDESEMVGSPFLQIDPSLPQAPDAEEDDDPSPKWLGQASALALSTTFVLVTPPVGLALFTYAALRQGTAMDLIPRDFDIRADDFLRLKDDLFKPLKVTAS